LLRRRVLVDQLKAALPGIRTERLELDEAWSFVGKKQKNVQRHETHAKKDQYVFIGMAGTQKAIISWGVGKRNGESTMDFLQDLRSRVIGQPEISTEWPKEQPQRAAELGPKFRSARSDSGAIFMWVRNPTIPLNSVLETDSGLL
jgi:hypothetical protein